MSKSKKALNNNRPASENLTILIKNSIIDYSNIEDFDNKVKLLTKGLDDPRLKGVVDFSIYNDLIENDLTIKNLDTYDRDFFADYINIVLIGTAVTDIVGSYSLDSLLHYFKKSENLEFFDYFIVKEKCKSQSKNYSQEFLYNINKKTYSDFISIHKTGDENFIIGKLNIGNVYYTPFKNKDDSFCVLKDILDNNGKYSTCYDSILIFECDQDPSGFVEMPYCQKKFNN